jgi:hypothetical protein
MTRKKTPKAAVGKVVQRLSPAVFCCELGPRFRGKGARVQCIGRKGHPGLCRASEFSAWDRKDPTVWVLEESRGSRKVAV